MKKPINPKKRRRAPINETKGADFIPKRAKVSNSWQELLPNPEIHFQKDRAVRFMLFIRALIKDLFAPIVLNKEISSIILSYHLDLMSLNSLLKITSNSFESAFYPPSLIQKESKEDHAKQLAIPYMVTEIFRAMQFLQVQSVIDEICNPWTLLNQVNPHWSTPSDIHNILEAGKQFLKNISRLTTIESFMMMTEEFIEIVIKSIQTKDNLLDKDLLQTNLITAMYKALKDLVMELNKESNLLAQDLLSSNEDISGTPQVESSASFGELISRTKHTELNRFYQYLQAQELKLGDEALVESYLSSLKFPIGLLYQLIVLQCFKWPSIANFLYQKLNTHTTLNGIIFATGLINPLLKESRYLIDRYLEILATKVKRPAYESHYFIFLFYFFNSYLISMKLKGRKEKFEGYKEMLQFYFTSPGLINNILFLMEAKWVDNILFLMKDKLDSRLSPQHSFSLLIEESWRNYPASKLEYRLIPYLGADMLSTNITWLYPENTSFASMTKGVIEKIKYFMFYFSASEKQAVAVKLENFLRVYSNFLAKNDRDFLTKVVEKELPKKLTILIPPHNFYSSSSVSPKSAEEQEQQGDEKTLTSPQDHKLTLLNNLRNNLEARQVPAVMRSLHQLYHQSGFQNIWLELMVFIESDKFFDHPLLFLLRHANKAQLEEITWRCPVIWANLPDNHQLDKICQSNFPLSPLNSHFRVKAATFKKYLNPHSDTLLTYAIKKANPDAVSFILELDHTLVSQPDAEGNLPLKLASGSRTMEELLAQASKAEILNF